MGKILGWVRAHRLAAGAAAGIVVLLVIVLVVWAADGGGSNAREPRGGSPTPGSADRSGPSTQATPSDRPAPLTCVPLTNADLHSLGQGLRSVHGATARIRLGVVVPLAEPRDLGLDSVMALRLRTPDGRDTDVLLASSTLHPGSTPGITYGSPPALEWLTWGIYVTPGSDAGLARATTLSSPAGPQALRCLYRAADRADKDARKGHGKRQGKGHGKAHDDGERRRGSGGGADQ